MGKLKESGVGLINTVFFRKSTPPRSTSTTPRRSWWPTRPRPAAARVRVVPLLLHPLGLGCRVAVAQSVAGPSNVPIQCNSTDVGSNPGYGIKVQPSPSLLCFIFRPWLQRCGSSVGRGSFIRSRVGTTLLRWVGILA